MAAGRTLKSLVGRRRRIGDEGEEDDGPVIVADSQSGGSILSDADDDNVSSVAEAGATASDGAGTFESKSERSTTTGAKGGKKARKPRKKGKKVQEPAEEPASGEQPPTNFKAMADTEAMMNGLKIDDATREQEAVDFETMDRDTAAAPAVSTPPAPSRIQERAVPPQRREHEEYRKKRDADPAFVPNRGNFFMHDTRAQNHGPPPQVLRGGFAGRGRGRGGTNVGGPFSPANQMAQAERAAEQPWKHDLHDTINEEATASPAKPADVREQRDREDSARLFPKPIPPPGHAQPRVINFSTTTLVGKVQIRVLLSGMKAPVAFSEVPWKHYVRLPNHRPPLRRDKPVRVSLPDRPPHYIFPSADRSFIFIPRQQRPNQHGYQRGGSYQRSVGGHGGFSSRRTSMYGGSIYASSMAGSRRSSMAGGISRADAFSPASFAGSNGMILPPPNRPVVRLPHGGQSFPSAVTTPSGPLSGQHAPIGMGMGMGMPVLHTYPLPQQPTYQGTPTSTMHQPRPQKTISVTGIESPALLQQVPSNEAAPPSQPFESQLPAHMVPPPQAAYQQPYFSPRQQYAYPSQQQHSGTPLSGIPEQAMQFQPQMSQMGYRLPQYYPQYPPPQQQNYYYSPPGPEGYGAPPMMPMYMPPPPQQGYRMMPPQIEMPPQHQQSAQEPYMPQNYEPHQPQPPPPQETEQQTSDTPAAPSGMMAEERNGMVFYVPRSDIQEGGSGGDGAQQAPNNYQPAESFVPSYAMPGLPPPTPAPDQSYYYPAAPMFYPQP